MVDSKVKSVKKSEKNKLPSDREMQLPKVGAEIKSEKATYKILSKLGQGALGVVYKVTQIDPKNPWIKGEFALKAEQADNMLESSERLGIEYLVMSAIRRKNVKNLLPALDKGIDYQHFLKFIIIPLIHGSLNNIMKDYMGNDKNNKPKFFSRSTALQISIQSLQGLKELHDMGFLHRDLKPANMAVGETDRRRIYLLDYGMCRYYRMEGGYHMHKRENIFIGTVAWASRDTLRKKDYCRAYDLEAWYYIMLYYMSQGKVICPMMLEGWEKYQPKSVEKKVENINENKDDIECGKKDENKDGEEKVNETITIQQMVKARCDEMRNGPRIKEWNLPHSVLYIWQYIMSLHWYDRPDYEYILRLLEECSTLNKWCSMNEKMDWEIQANIETYKRTKDANRAIREVEEAVAAAVKKKTDDLVRMNELKNAPEGKKGANPDD